MYTPLYLQLVYLNVYLTSFSRTASKMSFAGFNATRSDVTLEKSKKASWQKAIGKCRQIQPLVPPLLVVQAAPRLEAHRGSVLIVARSAISRPTKSVLLVLHKILNNQHLCTRTPDSLVHQYHSHQFLIITNVQYSFSSHIHLHPTEAPGHSSSYLPTAGHLISTIC